MRFLVIIFITCWSFVQAQKKDQPYVILVSFDGFRHDYVSKYDLPNFKAFVKKGASAEGLIPSFPSKTFPNHYTLVTGLYPGNNGLVDNSFYDKKLNVRFTMQERELVENPAFYGGTPLWQLAQQHGLLSASCFWTGSEAPVLGEYPTYYSLYDEKFPNEDRITMVLDWLKLPKEKRPHFISLYFSLVDTQGHKTGPNSTELKETLLVADSLLGKLMDGLAKIKLPLNVILVSDHGMMELKQEEKTWIILNTLFNVDDATLTLVNNGTHAHVYTSSADSLYSILKKQEQNYKVYKKEMFPERWHYSHDRVGDILIMANPEFQLQVKPRKMNDSGAETFGAHGFDPQASTDMYGIFYAAGPNIKPGKKIKAFENVHVYSFIAKILNLTPPKSDSDIKVLEDLHKK